MTSVRFTQQHVPSLNAISLQSYSILSSILSSTVALRRDSHIHKRASVRPMRLTSVSWVQASAHGWRSARRGRAA